MLAPKCPTFNGRPTFANPMYLKKAQYEKPCLYVIPHDQSDLANRLVPDREETLTLEENDSFAFVHELKQEMHADLKYVESLEDEIDELESDKAKFSNMYDMIFARMECDCLAQNLSEQTEFEREQYFKIQDLKAQLQDKNIAISELKKLIDKCKGKYVDTKFDKPSVVRQPNAQRIPKPSILGKPAPFSDSLERTNFAKKKSVSKTNESEGLSKIIQNRQSTEFTYASNAAVRKHKCDKPGIPRLGAINLKDKVCHYTSHAKLRVEVEEHPRISSISNKTKSVTACNDSLNSRSSNANAVCATCGKCVFNLNHDACVSKFLNDVNARKTKKPKVLAYLVIGNPKRQREKSVQTPLKKTVASESTTTSSKSYYRMLYQKTSKAWKWWIAQQCPSSYTWVPKTQKKWVPRTQKKWVPKTQKQWIVQLILFIVDSGCTKHMTGNVSLLCNFVDKYLGNITIKRVYYVEGLNHNLFSVGQFCDADLEVAFRKSTCFVRDLQGNDLLTGNRGSDLYTISLQDTTSSTPICLMAKASPTQACEKAKRSSFKSKTVPSSKGRLNLLHMDLCGPMRVASINGKKYILVIVDDYSRYTWTLFLRSKDETPEVLKEFLTMIQRNLQAPVISVRTDRRHYDLCAICCHKSFPNLQDGREKRILNGPLKEEVYVAQPADSLSDLPDKLFQMPIMPVALDTRKSNSGRNTGLIGDKLVSWGMSKKQDCTAMSSAEAEYVALSASCAQVMWMRTQLQDYGFNYNKIPLYCDSQSAIAISCNPVQHSRTKHIHTRYHFIKEQVENGIIELYFVRTEYQLADMFTKALPEERFQYLVRQIGMRCLTPAELEVLTKESA
ncbi:retrovirus-related pol polyprotein from transposon TNT 1-94 [Tanacetum coccineum]|uniref:Retrovirus-related pol polyprotein from transposon TNT 1-94 n=1 Tax=Tanacetum coccineum TaxID=301880 RepID=A0ABQ5C6D9_9ASTR